MKVFQRDEQNNELIIKDLSQDSWTIVINKMKYH